MTLDEMYMEHCIELAIKGAGHVSPNPLVGCVIVKNGKIISEGYHKKFGSHHAEANVINSALRRKSSLKGSTLYVNLEPCFHHGKTPPCTDKIIENKISRVVIGITDPNPLVNGKSIRKLKRSGVRLKKGVLAGECRQVNKFFLKHIRKGIPYVTVKIAQTLDAKIAGKNGSPKRISSPESRKLVHKLRSAYDAVLVGRRTVEADDPRLTVRHVKGRNPRRIVIDPELRLSLNKRIFKNMKSGGVIILASKKASIRKEKELVKKRAVVIRVGKNNGKLDLRLAMKKIAKLGISSILVEGGTFTAVEFIRRKLADELMVFIAPKKMGSGISSFIDKPAAGNKKISVQRIGKDTLYNIIL